MSERSTATESLPAVLPEEDLDLSPLTRQALERTKSLGLEDEEQLREAEELTTLAIRRVFRQVLGEIQEKQFDVRDDRVDSQLIDRAIAEIDAEISAQLAEVMRHPELRQLESSWRSLRYLVDASPAAQNVRVSLLNTTRDQLSEDLKNQGVQKSAYFHHLYSQQLGSYGGLPYSAVVTTFDFGPKARDMSLLKDMAAASAMSHAPLLTAAKPEMLGVKDFRDLAQHGDQLREVQAPDSKLMREWRSFRDNPDARYVAMTLPRMMLRQPYGPDSQPIRSFAFDEGAAGQPNDYVWGSSAFALAANMSRGFGLTRWYHRITGEESGGMVANLPLHTYTKNGIEQQACPTEIHLNMNQEKTLSDMGFLTLTMHREKDFATFFYAQTPFDPSQVGQGEAAERMQARRTLEANLTYTLIVTRMAHYLKGMLVSELGKQTTPDELQKMVKTWVGGYVLPNKGETDMAILAVRPLQAANVEVTPVPGKPGHYDFKLAVSPHYVFAGANMDISMVPVTEGTVSAEAGR